MRILAYTVTYASPTVTFITNELKQLDLTHQLKLIYSIPKELEKHPLKDMTHVPLKFNKLRTKVNWWLEKTNICYSSFNLSFYKNVNQIINKFNPDIIHCHFGTDFLKLYDNLSNKNRKLPILISFYGYDATERLTNKAILKAYRKALKSNNIFSIGVSRNLVQNINTLINPFNKALVLHSGIDTAFFTRKNEINKSNSFTFLQVSSFNEKKGHLFTLHAFAEFIKTNPTIDVRFIIAGFGPLKNKIKEKITQLGVSNKVILRGPVSPSEMVKLSSEADCFVHMSITANNGDQEGLPNVLLEAMSLELPILSTRHAGIPEIIEDGINGILCDEKNMKQYIEGFKNMLQWKITPINRIKAIDKFSILTHMNELNILYSKITV